MPPSSPRSVVRSAAGVCAALLTAVACQAQGSSIEATPAARLPSSAASTAVLPDATLVAAQALALAGPLPYAVDVAGRDTSLRANTNETTLSELLNGKRYTVLHTFPAVARDPTLAGSPCRTNDCRQVSIYNHSDATTLVATVDVVGRTVLDVHVMPDAAPALTGALAQATLAVVGRDPSVQRALGGRGFEVTMGPVGARQARGPCAVHWCVLVDLAPEGEIDRLGSGDRLVVLVDVDGQQVVDVLWRSTLRREPDE